MSKTRIKRIIGIILLTQILPVLGLIVTHDIDGYVNGLVSTVIIGGIIGFVILIAWLFGVLEEKEDVNKDINM